MDINDLDENALDDLADRLADRLEPGSYGNKIVLNRRQLVGVATGTLTTGALLSLGVDEATAQAAGSIGTSSSPVDVVAYQIQMPDGGSQPDPAIQIGQSGAGFYLNASGEVIVVDESGNTTVLS